MTLDEKFFKYHRENPEIFDLFVRFTREVKQAGFHHYGTWAIANRIRWHKDIDTRNFKASLETVN